MGDYVIHEGLEEVRLARSDPLPLLEITILLGMFLAEGRRGVA